jgi:hypothetical protein
MDGWVGRRLWLTDAANGGSIGGMGRLELRRVCRAYGLGVAVFSAASGIACSGSPPPEPQPARQEPVAKAAPSTSATMVSAPAESSVAPAPTAPPVKAALPRNCDGSATPPEPLPAGGKAPEPCYPAQDFVERLCANMYPGVPLVMFGKGSPWRRGYLRFETKAWTTTPSGKNEKLIQDEEVLILQADASKGEGVQYESGAAFYALRWDGTCVKLTEEELMKWVPWAKKTPLVDWGLIEDGQQQALRANPKVPEALAAWRKQCRGSSSDAQCKKLQQKLSDVVVAHVREGTELLPDPTFRP